MIIVKMKITVIINIIEKIKKIKLMLLLQKYGITNKIYTFNRL